MLRQSVILFVILLISNTIFSQEKQNTKIQPDPRLYEVFSQDEIQAWLVNNPIKILYYNYFLNNSYFLSTVVEGKPVVDLNIYSVRQIKADKTGGHPLFNEDLSKFSKEKFNVLKYDFFIQEEHYSHYVLGKTGKVMVFYPKKMFEKAFQDYLASLGISSNNQ